MRKRVLTFLAAVLLVLPAAGNIAVAGGPPGEGDNPPNQTGSEGKPCNADHGHPQDGLANNPECDGDADADADAGDTRCHHPNSLSAALGDPLGEFDTVGHELWEAGVQVPPLTEHPEADGQLTGAIYDGFDEQAPTPVQEVGFEAACAGDFLIDGENDAGFDL